MAQSALTVTPPNPTPPTNMQCTGATGPNPPNFTKVNYAEMYGDLDANGNWTGTSLTPGDRKNPNPPPYYDDGAAGPVGTFAANVAALAGGTGATSGGTENTYPGAAGGAVPASTSVPHEGAGTEVAVTNPGNITHTYVVGTFDTSKSYSDGPVQTAATISAGPNATHASSLSPVTNPTLTAALQAPTTSGAGTAVLTCTGTGFVPGCRIWVDNREQTTTFVSATSLTATIAKKALPGTQPVDVKLGGVAVASTKTITWT
jgi:hypothetical protein